MRFHHLTVSAFGPFPGTETVDFDDLNAGGLFLLTGPTGAGKTSVLDALCFALYGAVPGVRGVKALKSHHAAPDARPEVTLDFSIGGRRFVVRRSPEWSRPKRRGRGSTTEKASASLVELTDATEHFLSSRAQEVGHLVSGLVGMRVAQFAQVAMLPQGEFARFLRADSQDRHDVLQQLFKTDRFARIEDWVHERSRALRDRAGAEQQRVQRALDAVADRAGADLPEELWGSALAAAEPACIRSWAGARLAQVEAARAAAGADHQEALAGAAQARAAHDQASRHADLVARRDRARADRDCAVPQDEADAAAAALQADARAGRCLPVLTLLADAEEETAAAATRVQRACAAVTGLDLGLAGQDDRSAHPDGDGQALAERARALRERIAHTEALLPRAEALAAAREAQTTDGARLGELRSDAEGCRLELATLPAEQERLREETAALAATAATGAVLDLEVSAAREARDAARDVPDCEAELLELRERRRDARDRAADARERMQDLIARRLAGMAAELAGRLAEGTACPVCGSSEHPEPARQGADAVTEEAQQQATATYHERTAEHTEVVSEVADAEARLAGLRKTSGGLRPEEAGARLTELERQRATAQRAEAEREQREARLRELESRRERLQDRLHDLETKQAAVMQALTGHEQTIAQAEWDLAAAVDSQNPVEALPEALRRLRAALATVETAEAEVRAEHDLRARVAQLTARAEASLAAEGFTTAAQAHEAGLDEEQRTRLQEALLRRTELLAKAEVTLADPEVQAVGDLPAPDLTVTRRALEDAEQALTEPARRLHEQESALTALRQHLDRLEKALDDWGPAHAEHVRTESIARLVRGTGPDNYLQMRLSAYVLATRLDQVLAAANERLSQMRDQRYLLERTGRAGRRNAQAGLGLQVLDSWTGEVRDPATLSGGESFVVSLSLALGLADVVTQEAGGAEIDTLFVDEGFGTLDADTLDDVMDRLDGLRAGGRTVGVVSHVPELRTRIPTQLHVQKRRDGSSLAVRTLTA